ncbi:Endonuclease, Uma2 family (restriction endonuclease fold) [Cyclobacterium lianum]|uniref:Endonuclease, Uma2 family (Restriction endonuclease fold) n=1 Tax=Cyclobacterium lianum TaxID=388280 RepID=A0A1M7QHT2_9BACT|nr:Uma2 family endonuclease [Cyclobacterium lianum]SHN30604.1 Endonuclease, Uma2 family (restriction endonuclease fold) [Cyclobacterium lianum]
MDHKDTKDQTKEPFTEYGRYSYADYLTWQMDKMVELIQGKVFKPAAAPGRKHQEVSLKISSQLYFLLKNRTCKVFEAPFDVRLPVHSKKNEDIFTVVQPDICVVCDRSKLDEAGCIGAPDLIVEILSPGNNRKEIHTKFSVYEESGVREYWVIHPSEQTLLVYTLRQGKYVPSRLFTVGDIVSSECIAGFHLDVKDLFEDLD